MDRYVMNNKVKIVTDDSTIHITGETHTHTQRYTCVCVCVCVCIYIYIIACIVRKLYYKYKI